MPRTISEITGALLRGDNIRGVILSNAIQRRMLQFFLRSEDRSEGPFRPEFVQLLKSAFAEEGPDDAVVNVARPDTAQSEETDRRLADAATSGPDMPPRWSLHRIEATGVGGVTRHGAGEFVLDVCSESLAIDGFNGQGKSSLASLVMLALTGHRIGPHGPTAAANAALPVREADGKRSAKWPPAVAYPDQFSDFLTAEPSATIRLIFEDGAGNEHVTERVLTREGIRPAEPVLPRGVTPLCVELSVLVPNRIAHVRVGEETRLVEVLVELIGLEPLRLLGEHVAALCHGNKNFVGFLKKGAIEAARAEAVVAVTALVVSDTVKDELPWSSAVTALGDPCFSECAQKARSAMLQKKADLFTDVTVAPSLDLSRPEDITKVQQASAEAEALLGESLLRRLPSMAAISQINALSSPAGLRGADAALATAHTELEKARRARDRQIKDNRLRLKALAARWHADQHPGFGAVDECPLCDRPFGPSAECKSLAEELGALRQEGDEVTRSFEDACRIIEMTLSEAMTASGCSTVLPADPVRSLLEDLAKELRESAALSLILSAPRDAALDRLQLVAQSLPQPLAAGDEAELSHEVRILAAISNAGHAIRLARGWPEAKRALSTVREEILGRRADDGTCAAGTLMHSLEAVTMVARQAAPIDAAIQLIEQATRAHARWHELQTERELRQRIVSAIEPLKGLTRLVEEEAREALSAVTGGTVELFNQIYAGGHLGLSGAVLDRRSSLMVEGQFGEALVDASLVANTSWLRAFLWAFALTLRSRCIEAIGHNPMPLLLLDDPQATFDHCNERQWAQLLAEMAAQPVNGLADAQLLVTSHDARLFDLMELHGGFGGRRAAVCGLCPRTGILRVIDGGRHAREWDAFNGDPRPETAQRYIEEIRNLTESKLGIILHVYGIRPPKATLKDYMAAMESKKEMPFFSSPEVRRVMEMLASAKSFTNAINASHHDAERRTLGELDARAVHKTWQKVDDLLDAAYVLARRFQFYGPRQITPATVLPFPPITRFAPASEVANSNFAISGRVAAATDGRVIFGEADADRWKQHRFVRHSAARVLADSLAPIATVGDILILRNFGTPRDGDLVVADIGGIVRARRLRIAAGDSGMVALLAEPNGPGGEPPLIVESACDEMRIVEGVLYAASAPASALLSVHEVEDLGRSIDVTSYAGPGGSVWQIDGDSAVPVALSGQLLVVGAAVENEDALHALDGTPVFATIEGRGGDPEQYFKRLRLAGTIVVLESIESSGRFPPIVCSLADTSVLPRLMKIAPVKGVLFPYS